MSGAAGRRSRARHLLLLAPALPALVLGLAAAARAETPAAACARLGTDDTARPIPESLVPAVDAAFGTSMPAGAVVSTTVFRCAGGRVLACMAGANLPCGPADTSRAPAPGAVDWCRQNSESDFIPAYVTGHDTIYAWRCRGGAPAIDRQILQVDPRGFVAEYWKVLPITGP
jgi:hypothetical protein